MLLKKIFTAAVSLVVVCGGTTALAQRADATAQSQTTTQGEKPAVSVKVPERIGLGQRTATEPAKLSRLGLADPLIQQKYLNEPDMMRFLRGTYSEACTRGFMASTLTYIKNDTTNNLDEDARTASGMLLSSRRIWKLTSFEMEQIFGKAYTLSANHCDCLMQEVSDADLVNPKKGIEVVKELSETTQKTCERIAKEKTELQYKAAEKIYKKGS